MTDKVLHLRLKPRSNDCKDDKDDDDDSHSPKIQPRCNDDTDSNLFNLFQPSCNKNRSDEKGTKLKPAADWKQSDADNQGGIKRKSEEVVGQVTQWQCKSCSLLNVLSEARCTLCNGEKPAEEASSWACLACTLMNNQTLSTCEACGTVRPKRKKKAQASSEWACLRCTLINSPTKLACGACGNVRQKRKDQGHPSAANYEEHPADSGNGGSRQPWIPPRPPTLADALGGAVPPSPPSADSGNGGSQQPWNPPPAPSLVDALGGAVPPSPPSADSGNGGSQQPWIPPPAPSLVDALGGAVPPSPPSADSGNGGSQQPWNPPPAPSLVDALGGAVPPSPPSADSGNGGSQQPWIPPPAPSLVDALGGAVPPSPPSADSGNGGSQQPWIPPPAPSLVDALGGAVPPSPPSADSGNGGSQQPWIPPRPPTLADALGGAAPPSAPSADSGNGGSQQPWIPPRPPTLADALGGAVPPGPAEGARQIGGQGRGSGAVRGRGPAQKPRAGGGVANAGSAPSDPDPGQLLVCSWNVDGLEEALLEARTNEVISIILTLEKDGTRLVPDIIFLQEVVPETYYKYKMRFERAGYAILYDTRGPPQNKPYFTLAFTRPATLEVAAALRENFSRTRMYRDLLVMEGIHKSTGCSLRLLTTHLESQKDGEAERRHQYSIALERLTLYDEGFALVIGDLNIREGEVKKEPLAKVVTDSWVAAGKPPHLKATWDMKLNTNKRFQGNFTPRARFDRCYYHHTDLDDHRITQTSFQFIGTKKMTEGVFPSDHWGLLVGLRITKKGQSFGKI